MRLPRGVHRLAHAPFLQETMFPTSHKLLSPKYVQPIVDEYISLTHRYLEERANQYNGLNITLRDFIVPLTFEASGYAFFGKDCPVNDLFEPFKLFDNNFHLLLAGIPKMFMKGPINALDELVSIMEKYLSDPGALDTASELVKEFKRIPMDRGLVSRPLYKVSLRFDGLLKRTLEMPLRSSWVSSGPSKRTPRLRHTGFLRSISNDRRVSDPWPPRLTRL